MNKIDYKELYLQQKKDLNAKINTNKILIREKKMLQQRLDKVINYLEKNDIELTQRVNGMVYMDLPKEEILSLLKGE